MDRGSSNPSCMSLRLGKMLAQYSRRRVGGQASPLELLKLGLGQQPHPCRKGTSEHAAKQAHRNPTRHSPRAALALPHPSHTLCTSSTQHRSAGHVTFHQRPSSAAPPQWRARVGPPTSPHASPAATTGRAAETRTKRKYGSPCSTTSRVESDCRKRVYSSWVRATTRRIGDPANTRSQAEHQRRSESSLNQYPQTLQTIGDRQTGAGSRPSPTNSPWATRTKMYWTRITRVCSGTGHNNIYR